ncbi:MAG TPA: hypothetical protein VLJ86_09705 [Ramlibacter sp.]|nr:hypothetical protein [Ramlibacter sp.]
MENKLYNGVPYRRRNAGATTTGVSGGANQSSAPAAQPQPVPSFAQTQAQSLAQGSAADLQATSTSSTSSSSLLLRTPQILDAELPQGDSGGGLISFVASSISSGLSWVGGQLSTQAQVLTASSLSDEGRCQRIAALVGRPPREDFTADERRILHALVRGVPAPNAAAGARQFEEVVEALGGTGISLAAVQIYVEAIADERTNLYSGDTAWRTALSSLMLAGCADGVPEARVATVVKRAMDALEAQCRRLKRDDILQLALELIAGIGRDRLDASPGLLAQVLRPLTWRGSNGPVQIGILIERLAHSMNRGGSPTSLTSPALAPRWPAAETGISSAAWQALLDEVRKLDSSPERDCALVAMVASVDWTRGARPQLWAALGQFIARTRFANAGEMAAQLMSTLMTYVEPPAPAGEARTAPQHAVENCEALMKVVVARLVQPYAMATSSASTSTLLGARFAVTGRSIRLPAYPELFNATDALVRVIRKLPNPGRLLNDWLITPFSRAHEISATGLAAVLCVLFEQGAASMRQEQCVGDAFAAMQDASDVRSYAMMLGAFQGGSKSWPRAPRGGATTQDGKESSGFALDSQKFLLVATIDQALRHVGSGASPGQLAMAIHATVRAVHLNVPTDENAIRYFDAVMDAVTCSQEPPPTSAALITPTQAAKRPSLTEAQHAGLFVGLALAMATGDVITKSAAQRLENLRTAYVGSTKCSPDAGRDALAQGVEVARQVLAEPSSEVSGFSPDCVKQFVFLAHAAQGVLGVRELNATLARLDSLAIAPADRLALGLELAHQRELELDPPAFSLLHRWMLANVFAPDATAGDGKAVSSSARTGGDPGAVLDFYRKLEDEALLGVLYPQSAKIQGVQAQRDADLLLRERATAAGPGVLRRKLSIVEQALKDLDELMLDLPARRIPLQNQLKRLASAWQRAIELSTGDGARAGGPNGKDGKDSKDSKDRLPPKSRTGDPHASAHSSIGAGGVRAKDGKAGFAELEQVVWSDPMAQPVDLRRDVAQVGRDCAWASAPELLLGSVHRMKDLANVRAPEQVRGMASGVIDALGGARADADQCAQVIQGWVADTDIRLGPAIAALLGVLDAAGGEGMDVARREAILGVLKEGATSIPVSHRPALARAAATYFAGS